MFMGEYQHTIDSKGRVIIPAKFRDGLMPSFVATKGLDKCLFVYPFEEWKKLESALRQLPFTKRDTRKFVRFFFAGAAECECDKQGRILIPANLREYAQLDKNAIFIGVGPRVEIWSQHQWDKYNQEADLSFEDIAEHLDGLVF